MRHRRGFTIIEVVLFVGISGFLIIGLMVGTSATIARQRYNDSVQDLAEYFRREYSAVINPENSRLDPVDNSICDEEAVGGTTPDTEGPNRGRSGCLIYGRLIVIGEEAPGEDPTIIWSYDVIGRELNDAETAASRDLKTALDSAKISVLVRSGINNPSSCSYQPLGRYRYAPQWLAKVERTTDSNLAKMSILIIRSPVNGSIHTLLLDDAIEVQQVVDTSCTTSIAGSILSNRINNKTDPDDEFRFADVDICVGSEDIFASGGTRRNIRIARDGHNGSAVEVIEQDDIYDENTNPGGNRCQL